MKKMITALLLLSATSAFAAEKITCQMQKPGDKRNIDKVSVSLADVDQKGEVSVDSKGRKIHDQHQLWDYNFSLTVTPDDKKHGQYSIDVTFGESQRVQDEVGSLSCTYNPASKKELICEEPLTNDNGDKILEFSCYAE